MTKQLIQDDLQFLHYARKQGVWLSLDGDDIVCSAKPGGMTKQLRADILQRKERLIGLLRSMGQRDALPHIAPDPAQRHEPFALTENQEAYWLGRNDRTESGGVGIHVFFELGIDAFDKTRFESAWNTVVQRHDMLRAVVLPDGRQRILENPGSLHIEEETLPENRADEILEQARQELSHSCYNLSVWPQTRFKFFHSGKSAPGHGILMWSLDTWSLDLRSMQIILDELCRLYRGAELPPPPKVGFRDYITALHKLHTSSVYARALKYWCDRIPNLPAAPGLPQKTQAHPACSSEEQRRFTRRAKRLPASVWQRVRSLASRYGLPTPGVLLTAYATTLSRWSEKKHFTLNIPRYNRLPMHPDINDIVGEFASFSLLEVDMRDRRPFVVQAREIQTRLWQDLEHAQVSGVRVLRDWKTHLGPSAPAVLAPFVFTSDPGHDTIKDSSPETASNAPHSWIDALERLGKIRNLLTQTPQVWLDSQFSEVGDELYISWDSLDSLFPYGMMDRMFSAYAELVESLCEDTAWQRVEMPLPEGELCLRKRLAGPSVPVAAETPWEAVQRHARQRPHDLAVADVQGELDWEGVHRETLTLKNILSDLGAGPGHAIAFALPKGRGQFIASLAIHACGATSVSLDHESPVARIKTILDDCRAALLLTDTATHKCFDSHAPCSVLDIEAPQHLSATGLPKPTIDTPSLHCIIYTSGSTGTPKGVMVPITGLLNMAGDALERFALDHTDVFFSLSPVYHDLAMFDMLAASLAGGTIVFPDPARLKDPGHWLERMQAYPASTWNTVPATMTMLLDYLEGNGTAAELPALRRAFLGGDWIPIETPNRLKRFAPGAVVVSSGGPTEISVWNMLYPVQAFDPAWYSIPYGHPINNTECHILDERLEDCPAMVAGEMFCSGTGVALGYMNDAPKTASAFFTHPEKGVRMYRTNDIVRLHHDGYVEFIGRRDNQVNINGYRIEPGEIENAIGRHSAVRQAVAVIPTGQDASKTGLVLWVMLKTDMDCTREELRKFLSARVPKYMLPTHIGIADNFPLTRNGKTNRPAMAQWPLPKQNVTDKAYAPSSPNEVLLAKSWKDLLGLDDVSVRDNFFEIGGNSIAAVRLYNNVIAGKYHGLSVASVFSFPTIQELADAMDNDGQQPSPEDGPEQVATPQMKAPQDSFVWPPVEPAPFRQPLMPATRVQQRMYYEDRRQKDVGCYNMCLRVDVHSNGHKAIDTCRLEEACNAVVAKHEILRTTFLESESDGSDASPCVMQCIHPERTIKLEELDMPPDLEAYCNRFTNRLYDLEKGPLVRFSFVRENSYRGTLFLGFHHIVMDGWSLGLFMDDFATALDGGPLPAPKVQQADIASWEQSPLFKEAARQLVPQVAAGFADGGDPSTIPVAQSLGTKAAPTPQNGCCVSEPIPALTVEAINALSLKHGYTPFAFMLTVFAALVSKYTQSDTAQIGTYVAARTLPGLEDAFGSMTCPAPMIIRLGKDGSLTDSIKKTMGQLSQAIDSCLLPFDDLIRAIAPKRQGGELPLFGVAFTYDNTPSQPVTAGGLTLHPAGIRQYKTSIDLEAAVAQHGKSMQVGMVFNPAKLDPLTVQSLTRRFVAMLTLAATIPDRPVATIARMALEKERKDSVLAPPTGAPKHATLLDYLDAAEQAHPETAALMEVGMTDDGPTILSSRTIPQLRRQADAITSALLAQGVSPGDHVALFLPRGITLTAAMLATQQCGAVFVPVPLSLAKNRIRDVLDISKAVLVCCERTQVPNIEKFGSALLVLDELAPLTPDTQKALRAAHTHTPTPDTDVCLFFTSGSEGKPKGVRLTHRNWVNRLEAGWHLIPFAANEACIAKTAIGFIDIFCELFQPLFKGIPVHVVREGEEADIEALVAHLKHWEITRAMIVVTVIRSILDVLQRAPAELKALRYIQASGEPLPKGLVHRFHSLLPKARLYNTYGSTEVAADVVSGEVSAPLQQGGTVPLGKPMLNCRVEVLDSARTPMPHGIHGEIAVAGPSVCSGYTDGPSPLFFERNGTRFFLTGDCGMWTEDGKLLGLGRRDRQLKIRGQRVEPGDVEETIQKHRHISEAAVIGVDLGGEPRLAACVVLDSPESMRMNDLRRGLRTSLSGAMMPSYCIELAELPRTNSGKVDRRELQRQVELHIRNPIQAPITPQGKTEEGMAAIWNLLLDHPVHDRQADFFSSGGHSLLAVRLVALVRERFQVQLQVKNIFDTPIFADLSELVDLLSPELGCQPDSHNFDDAEVF